MGAVTSGHHDKALKHIQVLYAFADRDLESLIIPHGIMPVHVSKLLPLLGWYTGMLKLFQLEFTKVQLTVVSNSSELHKAHVLHHVTRKHQIEADRVIGGIGSAAAVTMQRNALLSTALYVCLACAAPVLGARCQRREARENVHTTQHSFTDTAAAIPISVTLAGVVRSVISESETISAGSMLVASHGQMATDSAPRRSERVTQPPARLLNASAVYVAPGIWRANARQ